MRELVHVDLGVGIQRADLLVWLVASMIAVEHPASVVARRLGNAEVIDTASQGVRVRFRT
jgi:hypothetical protein